MKRFSLLTVTYGRVSFLNAALESFLNLETPEGWGEDELIVYNTNPLQELKVVATGVRVINCKERPSSLGVARNLAIEAATGTHCVLLDDDDFILPGYLKTLAKYWTDDLEWLVFDKQFLSHGEVIKEITPATANAVCFTRAAWEKVGRYQPLTVGEDKMFIGKLSSMCKGKRVIIRPNEIGFLYGWSNGVYHVSGEGEDGFGKEPAFIRVEKDLQRRIANGSEPTGVVELKPHSPYNWPEQAKAYLESHGLTGDGKIDGLCVVELGRFGDCCNILPILKHIHDTYGKPYLMVSREFASILDGVSYVIPHITDLPNHELGKALELARNTFKFVICAQIWGKNFQQTRNTDAYNKESWRNCGFLNRWDDMTMLPLFDQRDKEREAVLLKQVRSGSDKPLMIVQITKSISSPFPGGKQILEEITNSYGSRFHIVDISNLRCERIYDVLGLLEASACLVSCDTAMLHLAAATDVPVIALVNPNPWQGTAPRCNCVARLTYTEAAKEPLKVLGAIENLLIDECAIRIMQVDTTPKEAPTRNLFHVYDQRKGFSNASTITRLAQAQLSWNELYKHHNVIPSPYVTKLRTADKEIGDPRDLPYLKDALKSCMDRMEPEDICFFSNDDVFLHPELPDVIRLHVSLFDVCSSRRCEVKKLLKPGATPEEYHAAHGGHLGRDIFAFKKTWLEKHWSKIPDFLLGASRWDLFMAYLIRDYHGITLKDISSLDEDAWPAELNTGYVAHEIHKNYWSQPSNYESPSERHNRKLYDDNIAPLTKFTP